MKYTTDICVIGAGSGGLSFAAGAVQMGARVSLVERRKMGGDCLNYGCVPSKALLAASHLANVQQAKHFGVDLQSSVDFTSVHHHVHQVINAIAPHDSVERFRELGVQVILGEASFIDSHSIQVDNQPIKAKYFVIATGSSPVIPDIPELAQAPYFTNETIFSNQQLPKHLLIIGGGPIGLEMAHAHAQLGAKVSLFSRSHILPRDNPEMVSIIRDHSLELGIEIHEHCLAKQISQTKNGIKIAFTQKNQKIQEVQATHLLIACGRKPNIDSLQLSKAKVAYSPQGIQVDSRLRTTQKHICALGDVTGGPKFTHIAGYHASIAIRNIVFKLSAKVNYAALPWVTYTQPELAHVGMHISDAKARADVRELHFNWSDNDRAQAERQTKGKITVIVTKKGKILGVDMVGHKAGEIIQPWCLAISAGLKISHMANMISPYPTYGEMNKRIAGSFYTEKLFSDTTKKVVRLLLKL